MYNAWKGKTTLDTISHMWRALEIHSC